MSRPLTSPGGPITGRCYCGRTSVTARALPRMVSYCHCRDCRRASGAPVAAFAAFAPDDLKFAPDLEAPVSVAPGVDRWFCHGCGSPLAARYDYLPGQVYVPLGLLDQAADLPPQLHSHTSDALPWLHIDDTLERQGGSGRASLLAAAADA